MELSDINLAHAKHPWASEATLEALVRVAGVNNSNLMRIAKRLNIDINSIDISDNKVAQEQYTSLTMNYAADLSSSITSGDPIDSAMQIFQKTAEYTVAGVTGGTDTIATMFSLWNKKVGEAISGLFTGIGKVFGVLKAASIPVMAYFAQVIKLQQAESEAMIKHGILADDITMFTLFRKSAAGIGLSIDEMIKKLVPASTALANMNGGIIEAAGNLAAVISSDLKGEAKKLGYSIGDYTTIMIAQAETMYKLGKIESMDQVSLKRVHSRVSDTVLHSTMLANHFGLSREAMLAEMKQSLEAIDWIVAMKKSASIMANMGPDATSNIQDTYTLGMSGLGDIMGEDVEGALKEVFAAAVGNLNIDNKASSELAMLHPDLLKKLNQVPGLYAAVMGYLNNGLSGMSAIDSFNMLLKEFRDNPHIVANSKRLALLSQQQAYDPIVAGSADILALLVQSLGTGKLNQIAALPKEERDKISSAANIIGGFSDLRISMRKLHQTISPKFEHSRELMEMGRGWMEATEKQLMQMADIYSAFSEGAGAVVPRTPPDEFGDLRDFYKENSGPNPVYDMTQYTYKDGPNQGIGYYKTTDGKELFEDEMYENLIDWLYWESMKATKGETYQKENWFMRNIVPNWAQAGLQGIGLGPDWEKVKADTTIKEENFGKLKELFNNKRYRRDADQIMYKNYFEDNFPDGIEGISDTDKAEIQSSISEINTDTVTVASILKNITRINSDLVDINGII